MCDYSLCGIPNRLAIEGEELELRRFSTGSMGLASPADCIKPSAVELPNKGIWHRLINFIEGARLPDHRSETAVCIPPGADLILKDIPVALQQRYCVEQMEGVKFVQTGIEVNTYRDAIRFDNGCTVRLQDLPVGLKVEVLSLAPVFAGEEATLPTRSFL